jgi:hypothetical protein
MQALDGCALRIELARQEGQSIHGSLELVDLGVAERSRFGAREDGLELAQLDVGDLARLAAGGCGALLFALLALELAPGGRHADPRLGLLSIDSPVVLGGRGDQGMGMLCHGPFAAPKFLVLFGQRCVHDPKPDDPSELQAEFVWRQHFDQAAVTVSHHDVHVFSPGVYERKGGALLLPKLESAPINRTQELVSD